MSQMPPFEPGAESEACQVTGKVVPGDQIIEFQGYRVCAEGKQILLDRLRSGETARPLATALTDPGWRTARNGLNTVYLCIVIAILTAITAFVVAAVVGSSGSYRGADMPAFMYLFFLVIFGAAIGILVGQIMCASVPAASGARGLAIGAAVCVVANIVLSLLANLGGSAGVALELLGNLASIAGSILFLLFMRSVAKYLGEHELASSVMRFLIFSICFVAGIFVLAVLIGVATAASDGRAPGSPLLGLFGVVALVVGLVLFFWWLRLLRQTRDAITIRL